MRKLLVLFLLFCLFPAQAFAVSISVNNVPSSVSSDPFSLDVSVLGASSGQNYLRVDLYKDGTNNYFGETYSGSNWYKGSDGTLYFPISITDSKTTASASIQARLGTPTSTEFPGSGTYKLKIRRYTSSGNPASSDEQTPIDVTINYQPPASPTPAPKQATSATASTTTKSTATSIKISTPTPTKTSIPSSSGNVAGLTTSSYHTQSVNNSDKIASDFASIRNPSPTTEMNTDISVLGANKKEIPYLPFLLAGFVLFAMGVGFYLMRNWEDVKSWLENL